MNGTSFEEDARRDADAGNYLPPHFDERDPQNEQENDVYDKAWINRRKELDAKFKWAD